MGYSDTQKGYRLYNIATGSFFVNRYVSFREAVFSFKYPRHTFLETIPNQSCSTFPIAPQPFPHPADGIFPSVTPSTSSSSSSSFSAASRSSFSSDTSDPPVAPLVPIPVS